jgi:hypothetical protein
MGLLFVLMALAGCGGGGSSSSAPPVTSRRILWTTNWGWIVPGDPAARRYSLTAQLILKGANTDGTDFVTSFDSPSGLSVMQTLGSSGSVKVGTFLLEVGISSNDHSGGGGFDLGYGARAVVRITPTAPVDSQGHQAPDFQIDTDASALDSITVPDGQTIKAGASAPLIFTAHPRGAPSHILVLGPNSETVKITSGADHLSFSKDVSSFMTGLTPGTATLTVTVGGITSAPATVTVIP